MCFKNWLAGTCFLLAIFGCAKRDTPANVPIEVKLKGSGDCIANINRELKDFANGKSSREDVDAFWQCMGSSITEFERLTSGDGGGSTYSPESLRQFIQHYFLTTKKIPNDVLAGIMEVKRVLLSGTNRGVTRAELGHLKELFVELKAASLEIQPYAPVIFRNKKNASDAEVRAAAASLQRALARLGAWLGRENQSLKFQQIAETVNATAKWLQENGKDTKGMHTLRQAALVLPEVKSLLIGGDKGAFTGEDWPILTSGAGRGMFLYLAAVNGFDENLDAALNRAILPESATQTIDVISESASRHPKGEIPLQEFKNLYAKLDQTDWLPDSIKTDGLMNATKWLLRRLLGNGNDQPTGLNVEQIAKLNYYIGDWTALVNLPAHDQTPLVQEFNKILASSAPLSWDNQGRMFFPTQMPAGWTPEARRHMIWPYVILNWVKKAYTPEAALTVDNMNLAAQEVLPVLQSFGWLKSTKVTIGKRILQEADLFTLASNGDGVLDLNEATRYLAFVVSSYRSAQVWLDLAAKTCQDLQADCVRSLALQPGNLPLSSMPRLQATMLKWKPQEFIKYMKNAESTILGAPEALKFTTGDLLQTFQLFEYVEVFYELYDADHNELINLSEATQAYSVYGPTLGRLLPSSDLGFFTFLMKYGDTPFGMFGGSIAYNHWRWHQESWILGADRNILMNILSQLAILTSH